MTRTRMEYEDIKHVAMNDASAGLGKNYTWEDLCDNTEQYDRKVKDYSDSDLYAYWYKWTVDCIEAMEYES